LDKETRNAIERATQRSRALLEEDFATQLEGTFDVIRNGSIAAKAGPHLSPRQVFQRDKIVAAVDHKRAAGMNAADAVADYLRDAAFTTLNRFVALKMLEARELVQECVTKGEQSGGYREFCGMAPAVALLPDSAGYRLYIESLFDELSTEVKVLFDRRDPASVLWPKRATFDALLGLLNATELSGVWAEDETIGWVYQFFNGGEERRAMREASQAPRNSRELAVRNQFFTPRYVVQFLTDNTLGRIWYEMRGGETKLAERSEYMVRRPDETYAPRAKKDPRDMRVLDPACGSGHFLLYAFDLLITIYEEAFADAESPTSEVTGRSLAADYSDVEALRHALPLLVLAHNLHGVDIDPRCAQIAQLALWMRAQRAFRDFGIARAERSPIRRSNIVIAEPLVTDDATTKEFLARLGDAELGRVFTNLVTTLKLAGDLGLLLKAEKLIDLGPERGHTANLFSPPEVRLRSGLTQFLATSSALASTRRRLFTEDAAQGVGLLETAEKKFDVVLMNPPFGEGSTHAKKDFETTYPRTKNDIYAAFVERGIELLHARGRLGAITSRTGFFLSSFQRWREEVLLKGAPPSVFADLGYGVMDAAMVEAAAYCLEKNVVEGAKTVFLRVLRDQDKAAALIAILRDRDKVGNPKRFEVALSAFAKVPRSPFAYWVSEQLRGVFARLPPFESNGRAARQGGVTGDDFRWLRLWYEIPTELTRVTYVPIAKGGRRAPYFGDRRVVASWDFSRNTFHAFTGLKHRPSLQPASFPFYFRPGLTWPLRGIHFSAQAVPGDGIFSVGGKMAFACDNDDPLPWLAIFNSRAFDCLIAFFAGKVGGVQYEVGLIQVVPVPVLSHEDSALLAGLARKAWSLKRSLDTRVETSRVFSLPALLQFRSSNASIGALEWGKNVDSIESELAQIQSGIDIRCFELYGLGEADRIAITESLSASVADDGSGADADSADVDNDNNDETESAYDSEKLTVELLSWFVGVAFGRFDVRLATGQRVLPTEPEPFDPLPMRSAGMLPEVDAESLARPEILVDDQGHASDIQTIIVGAMVRTGCAEQRDLRTWLGRTFFPLHIKMYSTSNRKAPIYWQLATPSASYSVWLYIHSFTKDTLYKVQNDFAQPKVIHEERKLDLMRNEQGAGAKAAERQAIAAQESFIQELRAFVEELKRVAPLWNPNLDDGAIINFAPLWRLVPQYRPWQKELKATWDELCEGNYDWAHLAIHLWPERVVPKCSTDRSLAIAHGLEEVFWVEGTDGKWKPRTTPTKSIEELVRERSSTAVKAALKSLLEAPVPGSNRARGRKTATSAMIE
jgi:hypothetical protein